MRPHISTLPVGTSAYSNDRCRCDGCRAANAEYQRETRAALQSQPERYPIPHGTVGGYTNYACRCNACRLANTEAYRDWVRRRREATR